MRIELPPAEVRAQIPAIAPKVEEVEQLRERLRVEDQDLVELEHKRDGAAQDDTQRQADALRAGKPDPGRKATERAEALVKDQASKVAALEVAVGDAERDLTRAVAEHAPAYRGELEELAEKQRTKCRKTTDQLSEVAGARSQTFALLNWLEEPTRFRLPGNLITHLRKPSGDPYSYEDVITELAAIFDPPRPTEASSDAKPLRKIPRAI